MEQIFIAFVTEVLLSKRKFATAGTTNGVVIVDFLRILVARTLAYCSHHCSSIKPCSKYSQDSEYRTVVTRNQPLAQITANQEQINPALPINLAPFS